MTNTKSTKRALLASVMALFLCFTMLLGTTFAWFTDSATSGSNVITAGNLDLEVEYTLDGTNWDKLDGATDLFQKGLWEPGHTEVVALKITNAGSLALKYAANMNIVNEKIGTNKDEESITLSEILTVSTLAQTDDAQIAQAFADEDSVAYTATVPFKSANVLANEVELKAGNTNYLIVKVDMAESVDNKANAKDKDSVPSIEFGLNVLATQFTYEEDSFGNQYDADALFGTYIELEAGADLLAAMASAEADKPLTIMLNGAVEWPTEGHHGENNITDASAITIIGNGNTITATGAGVTPLGDVEAPMTLKDVKIVDNSVSYNEAAWEFTYLEMGGTKLVCENVTFADEIQIGTNATFTNCSFESNEENVYAVWVEDGSASFTNCTFTGYRGLKVHEDYGTEVSSVIVKDCTFSDITKKPGIALGNIYMNGATYTSGGTTYTNTTDTTVSITGCTFINCQLGDQNKYIYETDTDVNTFKFVEENNIVPTTAGSGADLSAAIANGDAAALTGDVQYNTAINNDATIYLAGNTFEATGTINLGNNADLTMKGGSYEVNGTYGHIDARPSTAEGSVLVFEDIDFSFNKKEPTYGTCTDRLGTVLEVCATVADAKTVVVFKNCTFDNAQVLFEGLSGVVGEFEATFENCTFNALTSSAPIEVMNYVKGTITVKNCTFNLECTSGSASAICVSPSSSTSVTIVAEDNTINAVAATPHTYDPAAGETEVDNVKVYGTPSNVKFISSYANTTVTETNTVKTGIAG
jgi:predicted ribosomally synthesized peptide with SipW-like signal peptide